MNMKLWRYFVLILLLIVSMLVIGCSGATTTPRVSPSMSSSNDTSTVSTGTTSTSVGVSAMEDYPVAEKFASDWNNNTTLMGVIGDVNFNEVKTVGVNGKANGWIYLFVSPSIEQELNVIINNTNTSSPEIQFSCTSKISGDMGYYQGLHPISDWKVDSTQAIKTAMNGYNASYNASPSSAEYVLWNIKNESTGKNEFYWQIALTPPPSTTVTKVVNGTMVGILGNPVTVYIDPTTGEEMPSK